jgi:UDPglucose 6-dehydrogenase
VKVTIVGTGYVGLVTGACLSDTGCVVTCVDTDTRKIKGLLEGKLPIYEPGLGEVVQRNLLRGNLQFSDSLEESLPGSDAVFIAVGTPTAGDGSAETHHVVNVAREIGRLIEHYVVVVTKSTVPAGTSALVREAISEELNLRSVQMEFDVVSNPEFLKEGAAVTDFSRPDRIVVGVDSDRARAVMAKIYRPFVLNGHPVLYMDTASAEITKYGANAMLALRISFMNLLANFCDVSGADIHAVRQGIAADPRIGPHFLYAGIGYGGSCFPKDIRALISSGEAVGLSMDLLTAVEDINARQKLVLVERASKLLGGLHGRKIAVWGLAFKPNTDDVRESPAIAMIRAMADAGATVTAYDPVAGDEASRELGDRCAIVTDPYECLNDADALLLATEWAEFRTPNIEQIAQRMRGRLVLDGRNVLDHETFRSKGFIVEGIGQGGAQIEP